METKAIIATITTTTTEPLSIIEILAKGFTTLIEEHTIIAVITLLTIVASIVASLVYLGVKHTIIAITLVTIVYLSTGHIIIAIITLVTIVYLSMYLGMTRRMRLERSTEFRSKHPTYLSRQHEARVEATRSEEGKGVDKVAEVAKEVAKPEGVVKPGEAVGIVDVKRMLNYAMSIGAEKERKVIEYLKASPEATVKPCESKPWYKFITDVSWMFMSDVTLDEVKMVLSKQDVKFRLANLILSNIKEIKVYTQKAERSLYEVLGAVEAEMLANKLAQRLSVDEDLTKLVYAGVQHIKSGLKELPSTTKLVESYEHATRLNYYVTAHILEEAGRAGKLDVNKDALEKFRKWLITES